MTYIKGLSNGNFLCYDFANTLQLNRTGMWRRGAERKWYALNCQLNAANEPVLFAQLTLHVTLAYRTQVEKFTENTATHFSVFALYFGNRVGWDFQKALL